MRLCNIIGRQHSWDSKVTISNWETVLEQSLGIRLVMRVNSWPSTANKRHTESTTLSCAKLRNKCWNTLPLLKLKKGQLTINWMDVSPIIPCCEIGNLKISRKIGIEIAHHLLFNRKLLLLVWGWKVSLRRSRNNWPSCSNSCPCCSSWCWPCYRSISAMWFARFAFK